MELDTTHKSKSKTNPQKKAQKSYKYIHTNTYILKIKISPNNAISASSDGSYGGNVLVGDLKEVTVNIVPDVSAAMREHAFYSTRVTTSTRTRLHMRGFVVSNSRASSKFCGDWKVNGGFWRREREREALP